VPADADEHWPASLADCTGLRVLHLSGTSAAPIPSGRYLKHLRTLEWQCAGVEALPNALRAATELETLHLWMAPERVACCTVVDSLPKLRRLHFYQVWDRDSEYMHADTLLKLRRRLRADVSYGRE